MVEIRGEKNLYLLKIISKTERRKISEVSKPEKNFPLSLKAYYGIVLAPSSNNTRKASQDTSSFFTITF